MTSFKKHWLHLAHIRVVLLFLTLFIGCSSVQTDPEDPVNPVEPRRLTELVARIEAGEVIDEQLPAGVFVFDAAILLRNRTSLSGVGQGETILEIRAQDAGAALRFIGSDEMTLADLTIRYSGDDFADVISVQNGIATLRNVDVTGGKSVVEENDDDTGRPFTVFFGRGVLFQNESQGIVQDSRLRDNESVGINFFDNSTGTVRNSLSEGNLHGIALSRNSRATLEGNTLRNNTEAGIVFLGDATGTVRNNLSEGNGISGIELVDSSQATLEGNTLRNNESSGIVFSGDATGTVRNNLSEGNAIHGIFLTGNSQATLEDNILRNNTRYGIAIRENANATLRDNQFSGNGEGEVLRE